jgi:hypothetical protein
MLSFKLRVPGKQVITLKFNSDTPLQTVVSEVVKSQNLSHSSRDYFLYNAYAPRKWLDMTATLEQIADSLDNDLELVSRFLIVKVELLSTTTNDTPTSGPNNKSVDSTDSAATSNRTAIISTLTVVVDVDAPLLQTLNFVAKKFQIEDRDAFRLYAANTELSLHQSWRENALSTDAVLQIGHAKNFVTLDSAPPPSTPPPPPPSAVGTVSSAMSAQLRPRDVTGYVKWKGGKKTERRWAHYKDGLLTFYRTHTDKPLGPPLDLREYNVTKDDKHKEDRWRLLLRPKKDKDKEKEKDSSAPQELVLNSEEEWRTWVSALMEDEPSATSPQHNETRNKGVNSSDKRVFGVPLAQTIPPGRELPPLVEDCIRYLEERALDVEGIFRLSGSTTAIEKYVEMYNSGTPPDLSKERDPHTVTGLLKLFFRELPEPLMTFELYDKFIIAQQESDPALRCALVKYWLHRLPAQNFALLKFLFAFLARVEQHAAQNKMAVQNLATIFGPTLLQPRDKNMLLMVEATPYVNGLISTLLQDYECFFGSSAESAVFAVAEYDYTPQSNREVTLHAGDLVRVLYQGADGWWCGEVSSVSPSVGLFPGSYVQLISASQAQAYSKRQKFLEEMSAVRNELDKTQRTLQRLEETRQQLQQNIERLRTVAEQKNVDIAEYDTLKNTVGTMIEPSFKSNLETFYSQLEDYLTHRQQTQLIKQEIVSELQHFTKTVLTENKHKKIRDRLSQLIEGLLAKINEESALRASVDDTKDTLFKDLTDLRALLK